MGETRFATKAVQMKLLLSFALSFFLMSCTGSKLQTPSKPEDRVQLFVRLSSDVKSPDDKAMLAQMCQGRMRQAIDAISDDAFSVAYVNQPIEVKDFKVVQTEIDGNLARVHYRLEILNPNGQDTTVETNEREVELLRVDGQWFLEAIRPKGSDQIAFTRGMIF